MPCITVDKKRYSFVKICGLNFAIMARSDDLLVIAKQNYREIAAINDAER